MGGGAFTEERILSGFERQMAYVQNNCPMALLTVIHNQTKNIDGFFCIYPSATNMPGVGEVVRILDTSTQGQGLGTKILQYLLGVIAPEIRRLGQMGQKNFDCFHGAILAKIYATADPRNIPSWKTWDKMIGVQPAFSKDTQKIIDKYGKYRAKKEAYGAERYCFEVDVFSSTYMPLLVKPIRHNEL